MSTTNPGANAEIVIIRRKVADDVAAHKGGAWKIAYADFVTAMMAFFLVMWLINAANEATRSQVASYFNPIKLTDSSTGGRGLNDPKDVKSKERKPGSGIADEKATEAEKTQEQKLLAEPMKALERIAPGSGETTDSRPGQSVDQKPAGTSDPFDPRAGLQWPDATQPPQVQTSRAENSAGATVHTDPAMSNTGAANSQPAQAQQASLPALEKIAQATPKDAAVGAEAGSSDAKALETPNRISGAATKPPAPPQQPGSQPASATAGASQTPQPLAAPAANSAPGGITQGLKISAEIKAEILKRLNIDTADLPATIEVRPTAEGQLISLTDRTVFGMFEIGSAQPNPKLVEILNAIAEVVKPRTGQLVIRGHTDSRPYRNRQFDNWQLSTARAQMAYYMLVRAGLDDQRVKRIEGLADREPLVPAHPDAPENRRIEILLVNPP